MEMTKTPEQLMEHSILAFYRQHLPSQLGREPIKADP